MVLSCLQPVVMAVSFLDTSRKPVTEQHVMIPRQAVLAQMLDSESWQELSDSSSDPSSN